jgi:thiosulfate/3-mercaptopyruvate sulfurtransferase
MLRKPIDVFAREERLIFVSIVAVVLFTAGCGKTETASTSSATGTRQRALPGVLVDSTWLSIHRSDADVIVVDARDAKEYAVGHIAGAVNVPPGDLLDPDPANSDNLAPVHLVEKRLGAAGIDMTRTVVIYDGSNYTAAARLFWVLEVHGHPAVAVLNGGWAGWTSKNLPMSTSPPEQSSARFISNMQPERLATKLSVMRAITEPGTIILDSRSPEEYEGVISKAARKGHIKSAKNIEFNRNLVFNKEGVCSLIYSDELVTLYRSELGDCAKVISYCNSGNRASVSYLALRVIGLNAAVYDGAWLEWGNDSELPIEQGPSETP